VVVLLTLSGDVSATLQLYTCTCFPRRTCADLAVRHPNLLTYLTLATDIRNISARALDNIYDRLLQVLSRGSYLSMFLVVFLFAVVTSATLHLHTSTCSPRVFNSGKFIYIPISFKHGPDDNLIYLLLNSFPSAFLLTRIKITSFDAPHQPFSQNVRIMSSTHYREPLA